MAADDRQSGLAALIGAFLLCVASLAFVLWIVAGSWGRRDLFVVTSADEAAAAIAERTRMAP